MQYPISWAPELDPFGGRRTKVAALPVSRDRELSSLAARASPLDNLAVESLPPFGPAPSDRQHVTLETRHTRSRAAIPYFLECSLRLDRRASRFAWCHVGRGDAAARGVGRGGQSCAGRPIAIPPASPPSFGEGDLWGDQRQAVGRRWRTAFGC